MLYEKTVFFIELFQFWMAAVCNTLPIPAGVFVPVFTIGEFSPFSTNFSTLTIITAIVILYNLWFVVTLVQTISPTLNHQETSHRLDSYMQKCNLQEP